MPETHYSEAPASMQRRAFTGESFIDIVGVTGSIPVTPTIRSEGFAAHCEVPGGFSEPRHLRSQRLEERLGLPVEHVPSPEMAACIERSVVALRAVGIPTTLVRKLKLRRLGLGSALYAGGAA